MPVLSVGSIAVYTNNAGKHNAPTAQLEVTFSKGGCSSLPQHHCGGTFSPHAIVQEPNGPSAEPSHVRMWNSPYCDLLRAHFMHNEHVINVWISWGWGCKHRSCDKSHHVENLIQLHIHSVHWKSLERFCVCVNVSFLFLFFCFFFHC